jgi:Tfp pilus assembly protein PilP
MMRWTCCGGGLILVLTLSAALPARGEPVNAEPAKAVEPSDDAPYDPAGRRDPFRPPRASSLSHAGDMRTPLERYEIGQLRVVAVIYDTHEPRAVVEDDEGLGYIVKVGTRIGANGGQVQTIERGRLLVREDSVDYYGGHHPTDVSLDLKTGERSRTGERGRQ